MCIFCYEYFDHKLNIIIFMFICLFVSIIKDPHPAESHMKEMDFLYLIKTPVDWKMFCDNLLKNFIQVS